MITVAYTTNNKLHQIYVYKTVQKYHANTGKYKMIHTK